MHYFGFWNFSAEKYKALVCKISPGEVEVLSVKRGNFSKVVVVIFANGGCSKSKSVSKQAYDMKKH